MKAMKIQFPECPTNDCIYCYHLPTCTKDEPHFNPSTLPPLFCPRCGSWLLGALADSHNSACLICGFVIERSKKKIVKTFTLDEILTRE